MADPKSKQKKTLKDRRVVKKSGLTIESDKTGEQPRAISDQSPAASSKKSKKISKPKKPKKKNTKTTLRKKRERLVPKRLPEKLLHIREYFGKSQSEMLRIVNPYENSPEINRARISQYESGTRSPSIVELYNYAKFAGIELELLADDRFDLPF